VALGSWGGGGAASGDLCERKGRVEWRAGAGGYRRKSSERRGELTASYLMKNGATQGQLGLDEVGGTRRGHDGAARLQPCVLSDWGCRVPAAPDSGGRLRTTFKGMRHPGRSVCGAPGVRCHPTGGPASASAPLTSGPRASLK
jgi:hypothetical protein